MINSNSQLPIHLLERVVLMSTDENDIVLDPFSGTGTSLIAAKRLGRQFIGFEIDTQYTEIAQSKLAQEEPCSKIGDIWVSTYHDEVATIRNNDWKELSQHYHIPDPIVDIDHTEIQLKSKYPVLKRRNGTAKNTKTQNSLFIAT